MNKSITKWSKNTLHKKVMRVYFKSWSQIQEQGLSMDDTVSIVTTNFVPVVVDPVKMKNYSLFDYHTLFNEIKDVYILNKKDIEKDKRGKEAFIDLSNELYCHFPEYDLDVLLDLAIRKGIKVT